MTARRACGGPLPVQGRPSVGKCSGPDQTGDQCTTHRSWTVHGFRDDQTGWLRKELVHYGTGRARFSITRWRILTIS